MTHPPIPWEYDEASNTIGDQTGRVVVDMDHSDYDFSFDADNAAFIVRAVNSHEALVSALQETLNEALGWLDEARGVTPDQLMANEWHSRAVEVLNAAKKP